MSGLTLFSPDELFHFQLELILDNVCNLFSDF